MNNVKVKHVPSKAEYYPKSMVIPNYLLNTKGCYQHSKETEVKHAVQNNKNTNDRIVDWSNKNNGKKLKLL